MMLSAGLGRLLVGGLELLLVALKARAKPAAKFTALVDFLEWFEWCVNSGLLERLWWLTSSILLLAKNPELTGGVFPVEYAPLAKGSILPRKPL